MEKEMDALKSANTEIKTQEQAIKLIREISGDLAILEDCYRCVSAMPVVADDRAVMILCRVTSLVEAATDILEQESILLSALADYFD